MPTGLKQYGADLILNGKTYVLASGLDQAPHEQSPLPLQEGDNKTPISLSFQNLAKGWGWPKWMSEGSYEYADSANLHRRLAWLPGCTVTMLAPSTQPDGPVAFGEYWDGTAANRRLIAAATRWVYEITPAGAISSNNLTGSISANGDALGKPERYKTGSVATRMYIPVQGPTGTDKFIVRTAADTYSETTADFRAEAMCVALDTTGDYVLWIADPDATHAGEDKGQIRQSVALADPQNTGSYAGASYPIGEASLRINDLFQSGGRILVARPDGIYTFNNQLKSTPVCFLLDALDDDNGKYIVDDNGTAVVPTIIGLVQIDGTVWSTVGPVSSNKDVRRFRNHREYAFCAAGEYRYAATYDGTDTYIWLGTTRNEMQVGSGEGPYVWHGAIAKIAGRRIAPGGLRLWTGWGKKLFIGFHDRIGYITLNDDFSPVANATSGTIYFPEGCLDYAGPAVEVEVEAVEYIGTALSPLSATDYFTVEFNFGAGWTGPGAGNSGTYQKRAFTTEQAGRRVQMRMSYVSSGVAELEGFVVTGWLRPVTRYRHVFRIKGDRFARGNLRQRMHRSPETIAAELKALLNTGWQGMAKFGETAVNVRLVDVTVATIAQGTRQRPTTYVEVVLDEAVA